MAADVHDVVHAAEDPVVAFSVAARGIAGEIVAGNAPPVLLFIALRITPDRAQHAGPRPPDDEESFLVRSDGYPVEVDNLRQNSGQRKRSRTWPRRNRAGDGRDHDGAGLGLPPGVDD